MSLKQWDSKTGTWVAAPLLRGTVVGGASNWDDLDGKPTTFPPEAHRHQWGEIDGKPSLFQPTSHRHQWSDIDGKPTAFTPASHKHTSADVTDASNDIGKGKGGKLVKGRDHDGKIFTYTPVTEVTDGKELVAKAYVDSVLAGIEQMVRRRPAVHWGPGTAPSAEYLRTHDVQAGDLWVQTDVTPMFMHEIKEV